MDKGSLDTSGMYEAAEMSNALQEKMYGEAVERGQPFYDIGLSGTQKLAQYLGIDTGKSRESIYESLTPQYTTTTGGAAPYDGDIFATLSGSQYGQLTPEQHQAREANRILSGGASTQDELSDSSRSFEQATGMSPKAYLSLYEGGSFGGEPTTSIDYDALNAAVDTEFAAGQERPDYFGSLLDPFSADKFEADPGYAFRKEEGEKSIARSAAAGGRTFSPRTALELQRQGQGLAAQEYGSAYDRYNIDQGNIFNRLSSIAGLGQQANVQLTGAGQQYAGQVGETAASLANARAAAEEAGRGRSQSMFNTLLSAGAIAYASDRNLKENIKHVGKQNGHNIYHFNYKGNPQRYEGVMAQEILKTNPEAVTKIDGNLAVYYDRIGLNMRELR